MSKGNPKLNTFVQSNHRCFALPDQRHLGYAEYGDPAGKPVLLFHGTPGSRFFRYPDDSIAAQLGVRLITIDRPDYGLSDFQPGRQILDWPTDVNFLANALGLDRFAVIGLSGGGPYAMACAYKIPRRLTNLLLVSSLGPLSKPELKATLTGDQRLKFAMAKNSPWLLRLSLEKSTHYLPTEPLQILGQAIEKYPYDADIIKRPGVLNMVTEDTYETFRQGSKGWIEDMRLLASPWGFDPSDLTVPTKLWHGEKDTNVPVATGRYLARTISNCEATYYPGEGHLTILNHWPEIMAAAAS